MTENRTKKEILGEIEQMKGQIPKPLPLPQLFLTDSTPEAMRNHLADQQGRSSIISDEGNIFQIMAGLYSDGTANIDVFLKGHAGGTQRIKRKDCYVDLPTTAVTFGLAIQPKVLTDLKPSSRAAFRGKGLLARFLYYSPPSNIGMRDVRKTTLILPNVKRAYEACIKHLLDLKPGSGESGEQIPVVLVLSDAALEAWYEFSEWLEMRQGAGGEFEPIQDFTGKLAGQVLRIAALCHLAKGAEAFSYSASSALSPLGTEIEEANMKAVIELAKKLIVHAQAVLESLDADETQAIKDAKWALNWIIKNVERNESGAYFFKQSALHCSSRFKKTNVERVLKALEILCERQMISAVVSLPTLKPTKIRYVNPLILEQTATAA